jgi:hypothetical protein
LAEDTNDYLSRHGYYAELKNIATDAVDGLTQVAGAVSRFFSQPMAPT